MSSVGSDAFALLSLPLECGFYGISVILFGGTLYSLFNRPGKAPMVYIAWTLFLLSTTHAIVNLVRVYDGFISYRALGPAFVFSNLGPGKAPFVTNLAIYMLQTLLGDGVVIYRAYVVWQTIWVVVLPGLLWCSVFICGSVMLSFSSKPPNNLTDQNLLDFEQWVNAYFGSSLAANLVGTALLGFRLWQINRRTASTRSTNNGFLMSVVRVAADSGILYSIALVIALFTNLSGSGFLTATAQSMIVDMIVPIIAIAFYLIIIRLNWKYGTGSAPYATRDRSSSLDRLPRQPVQVVISHFIESDRDMPDSQDEMKEHSSEWRSSPIIGAV